MSSRPIIEWAELTGVIRIATYRKQANQAVFDAGGNAQIPLHVFPMIPTIVASRQALTARQKVTRCCSGESTLGLGN